MDYFERTEQKYVLSPTQYETLMQAIQGELISDPYSPYAIRSIYFDTENDDKMRRNLDKPAYREKLRMRSYGAPTAGQPVFLEMKNKFCVVTWKKRLDLEPDTARELLAHPEVAKCPRPDFAQALKDKRPRYYVGYDRQAYVWKDDPQVRITFDRNIRYRSHRLQLDEGDGEYLLPPENVLLEIKVPHAIPLKLARALSAAGIRPASFSKAANAFHTLRKETIHESV